MKIPTGRIYKYLVSSEEGLKLEKLRRYLHKYFILFRIKTLMIYIFPLTLGLAVAVDRIGRIGWRKVFFAYLSFLCGSFFSSSLNFYADVESDRLHNNMYKGDLHMSDQPFVTGEMGKVETALLFLITGLGCVVFSLLVSLQFTIYMVGAVALLGFLYSHPWFRFKEKPVLDILTNAAGAVILLIAGWKAASPQSWPPLGPLVFGFVFSSTLYLPSVANDVPFDSAAGFRTSGVVFGAKRLLDAMVPLCVLLFGIAVANFVLPVGWMFKLFIAMALPGAIIFTIGMHLLFVPPHIRFNAGLLIYPITGLFLFYFVYALGKAL